MKTTALHALHLAAGARMVPFAGWEMPLNYGSQIREHEAVRNRHGLFDVSHMTVIDLSGPATVDFLRRLLANDVARLDGAGQALYSTLLAEDGGVLDDLIVYRRAPADAPRFRLVVNAATRDKVLAWLRAQADDGVRIDERELAMIAVQGPQAVASYCAVTGDGAASELAPFEFLEAGERMVARTGYAGEDGVEVILPGSEAAALWQQLTAAGVTPAGLAARDTLRLEAGLNLYGQDMDETTSPLESNLGWTVAWAPADRSFIGRAALEAQRAAGVARKLTGLVLEERGVLRAGQAVVSAAGEGVVTSGVFSPTLGFSVALARLPRGARGEAEVEIRGRRLPVRIVKPPFVRHGRRVFD